MNEELPRSYQKIKDIIHILRRVHDEMSQVCKAAASAQGENKTGMLLNTLAERQKHMVDFYDTSEVDADKKILDTWVQFVPSEHVEQHLRKMEASETAPEDLPYRIQEIQHDIAELISVIEDESDTEKTRNFVHSLGDRELAEAKHTSEAIVEINDF